MRRTVAVTLLAIVVGTGAIGCSVLYWMSQSLAPDHGRFVVPGIASSVEVFRDRYDVPHIFADSEMDAAAALGFMHASDRLWQMEVMRRLGHGRLAEVLGPAALPSDRLMRTLGISQLVERQFSILSPETQRLLKAYAAGVNAWIERHRGALPLEFVMLGIAPKPWRPVDSLVWAKVMAMRLSGNWQDELLRARMASRLTDAQLNALWYPDIDARSAGLSEKLRDPHYVSLIKHMPVKALAALSPVADDEPRGASDAWVVNKDLSKSGLPLLANDPHLGYSLPGLWYLARLDTPSGELAGATVPGVPFMILGHNSDIAWGMTSTQSDQQDLFIEKLSDDGWFYREPDGKWAPIESRTEHIAVAGAPDVDLVVRSTARGPIISDLVAPLPGLVGPGYALSLSASYLQPDDKTPDAVYRLNHARDWHGFVSALQSFQSPQQNIVYADHAGNIGFFAPGRVPIRSSGRGRMPSRAWLGEGAWTGWVPYDKLPIVYNPKAHRIVTANNKIVSDNYPYFITDDWAPPYRAGRIFELFDATPQHTVDTFRNMQLDILSPMARDLIDRMTSISPSDPDAAAAVDALSRWDGVMSPNAREPLLFAAWMRRLQTEITNDELGDMASEAVRIRPRFIDRVLNRDQTWCDDIETADTETCDQVLENALDLALLDIKTLSSDLDRPAVWGDFHAATFVNPVTSRLPWFGNDIGRLTVPIGGGDDTLNREAMRSGDDHDPFAAIHGPGYRAIYDLSDLAKSRFVIATGESGNPFSLHFRDFSPMWSKGGMIGLAGTREAMRAAKTGSIELLPVGSGASAPPERTPWIDSWAMTLFDLVRNVAAP